MFKNLMLKDFVDELGSASPAPGGGSAAALAASLSAALTSMVFNLTVGKKAYNEYDEERKAEIENMLKETSSLKFDLLDDIDKDADAFLDFMAALKLPKDTEDEKKLRKEKIEEGYKSATRVPMELAEKSFAMYKYIYIAAAFGNKNAVSDAGVAALLLQTAIESAVLNVKINLPGIKDEGMKAEIGEKCSMLVKNGTAKKEQILEIVNKNII